MTAPAVERKAYDIKQAAALYGVSTDVLRKAIHAGTLRAKKNGARYLFSADALAAWFQSLDDA
jgi:excisionase family DNA binding protein